ncbi:MAG: hypothetical protein K6B40_05310 [Firmicutes bacterium]|nr:hypothetical protein [Bacillota bacterium]
MSVANLTGTTWRFNEAITLSGAVFDINFINNNHSYQYTDVDSNAFAYGNDDYVYVYTMVSGWINESYRTIEITGGTDATSQTAIDWFEANAVQILPIIGNPLTVGGGTGSSGGTVTITDTQDAAGGTIRAITTNPAATVIEALTATANGTYTPAAGHAYGPVTVNVSGSGGLVYEEGTYTPSADTYKPTISFTNAHTEAPLFIAITEAATAGGYTQYDNEFWMYYDAYKVTGYGFPFASTNLWYGFVYCVTRTGTNSHNTGQYQFSVTSDSSNDTTTNHPKYWANNEEFYPHVPANSNSAFLAGKTYKWIAVWGGKTWRFPNWFSTA